MRMKLNDQRAGFIVNKDIIVLPGTLLVEKDIRDISEPKCWLLNTGDRDCQMRFQWPETSDFFNIPRGWRGLITLNRVKVEMVSGQAHHQELPLFALVKLQLFIDESRAHSLKYEQQQHWHGIALNDYPRIENCNDVERWLLTQNQTRSEEIAALATFLRRTEWYWLIRFLLKESLNSDKLHDLGARYGLSYSHFRRLCRNALGNSAKNELRGWRIARALLDVVEEGQSLTEVAMRHGYASSSHLSNDIRDAFGVSPRGLWNIIDKKSQK